LVASLRAALTLKAVYELKTLRRRWFSSFKFKGEHPDWHPSQEINRWTNAQTRQKHRFYKNSKINGAL
jgi:hypothetical protein